MNVDSDIVALLSIAAGTPSRCRKLAALALAEAARNQRLVHDELDAIIATAESKYGNSVTPEIRAIARELGFH